MAITEQFSGLRMDQLIGGPLAAAADASINLANSTADFINKVGFDKEGKVRTAAFMYQKRSANDDGTINVDEMKVDVPMLAIVPIPNLQLDEINVLFDMEVKESSKEESATDLSASVTGTANFGIVKVSISGSVSSHSSNTRSTDNSAKYHVDVRATNHGMPEGLARVLDMMAASISPSLVASTPKDANGQDLSADAKSRTERLKTLRQEVSVLENQFSAAQKALEGTIMQLKKVGSSQQKAYQSTLTGLLSQKEKEDETAVALSQEGDKVNQSWNDFLGQAKDNIVMLAASQESENKDKLSSVFVLKAMTPAGAAADYTKSESYYQALVNAQNQAVTAQKNANGLEEKLVAKKTEYNNAISGTAIGSKTETKQGGSAGAGKKEEG